LNLSRVVNQLHHQGEAILSLCALVSEAQARWKPDLESWSVLEVINHLIDEEALDFRRHLDHILHAPEQTWPKIDPMGWVTEYQYNQRQIKPSLLDFKTEREKSIAWLLSLPHPDWECAVTMPWGSLTAGDMMASWLAHDLLHLRQLVNLQYHLTAKERLPFSVEYAGEW
jgi:hypothetical protein